MENWNNLSKSIDLYVENTITQQLLSQKLIAAVTNNDKQEVVSLLKNGISLNTNYEMEFPLLVCMDHNHYDLCEFLINIGASISYGPFGVDAFWYSLVNKKHEFLKLFVEKKCSLTWQNETNTPAIIYATKMTDLRGVEILLSHYDIRVNEKDALGNTALHYNVAKKPMTDDDIEIGKLLLAAGADISTANIEGQTPEELAFDTPAKAVILANKITKDLSPSDAPENKVIADFDFSQFEESPEKDISKKDGLSSVTKKNKLKI